MLTSLKSDDVELRNFCKEDAERMAEIANNKNISRNLRDAFPSPYSLHDANDFIEKCLSGVFPNVFAITFKSEFVGNIGLFVNTDVYRKSAEIGYFIGEKFWNNGIATKSVNLITDFGFSNLELVRIYTGVFEFNTASMRVLEKCGFNKEAIFQKAIIKNNQLWDEHRYVKINPKFNDGKAPLDYLDDN